MFQNIKGSDKHWEKLSSILKSDIKFNSNNIIDDIILLNKMTELENNKWIDLKTVLKYPSKYGQDHCFDKFLNKWKKNSDIKKFIMAKFEQSGGTFEICLYSYFSCIICNNINVICLMNFNNQKDQLESRFNLFNSYLEENNLQKLNVKYIRDFKGTDNICNANNVNIIVCLYNSSSMKKTFEKVCSIAYIADKRISFSYDEIDIPESLTKNSALKKVHEEILNFHPKHIKTIFGISATTLGDIPGGFINPKISDIIFKAPSNKWSGIGHPDVKLYAIDYELKDDVVNLVNKISKLAIKTDMKFIGNLYISVRNDLQEDIAKLLSSNIKDLVVIVYNGTTSTLGGKFTIFNLPNESRKDTQKNDYDLEECFILIKKLIDTNLRHKFIFINHNMVLRGISIKGAGLNITDEIIFQLDSNVASTSQKYQRIAGLDLQPRRVYGNSAMIYDILEYQLKQADIYIKCEKDSIITPDIYLGDYINSMDISGNFSQKLSRNPNTKIIKSKGKIPLYMNVSRHFSIIKKRHDLIPIIRNNIKKKIIKESDVKLWKKVIKYIENDTVNKNQAFILDKHADSIIDKHWILHYKNMINNKGSSFSAGTDDHSKKSKCYIGIMKNKHIDGYGNCMVVFTDKTPKNLLKVL